MSLDLWLKTGAIFSECRRYRYVLWRIWGDPENCCMFIGLNSSRAGEITNDPTVRRCMGFSRDLGFDGLYMLNLFAFRATDPRVMKIAYDPIGPDNDKWIQEYSCKAKMVIGAWGVNGGFLQRDKQVLEILGDVHCLGITKHGYLRHPLYLKKELKPIMFQRRN